MAVVSQLILRSTCGLVLNAEVKVIHFLSKDPFFFLGRERNRDLREKYYGLGV